MSLMTWRVTWRTFAKLHCFGKKNLHSRSFCRHQNESRYEDLLRQCGKTKDLRGGRKIHNELLELGFDRQTLLGTLLVQMYGQCGCLQDAESCFERIRNPTVFSRNVMLAAYAQNGHLEQAKRFFDSMPERDAVTSNAMISAFARTGNVQDARSLFDSMPNKSIVSYNAMITAYAQQGNLPEARIIFDSMNFRDVVTWNAMLAAYTYKGLMQEARSVLDQMPLKNIATWNAMVTGYAQSGYLETASKLVALMPEWSEICWNAMLSGFCHSKRLQEARRLFDNLPFRGMVSWITMVKGYIQNRDLLEAWSMFRRMPLTDVVTWTAIVTALAQDGYLEESKSLFEAMPLKDTIAVNAMIAAYGLHGDLDEARRLFDGMKHRDLVSWNAMISAYAQYGYAREAMNLFRVMDLEGNHRPNKITFVGMLDACASASAIRLGILIHSELVSSGIFIEAVLATSLLSFYGKCGRLETARSLFEAMSFCDVILLNAMLAAYAQHGQGRKGLRLFKEVIQAGVEPDGITFICVMAACSHAGLLRDGHLYFRSLVGDFGLNPNVNHYSCMVDLLGRTGQLQDAEDLLQNMPFQPEYSTWRTLLCACHSYGDVIRGSRIAELAAKAHPDCASPYVNLSRLLSAAGKHSEGRDVRIAMDARRLKKPVGISSITIRDKVHEFFAGGSNHPEIGKIREQVMKLKEKMKQAGYVPDTKTVLYELEEEEDKQQALDFHSEKLAIVFGLMSTDEPLFVVKNLRVCSDCHAATKLISKIMQRDITVRDAHRFHHFSSIDGTCTCGDFW